MNKLNMIIAALIASGVPSMAPAHAAMVEKKQVRLTCSSLPYVFDCSIPMVTNVKFGSRCFYVAGGQSTLMTADRRLGFSNQIVSMQLNPGMTVTAIVKDKKTGAQSECVQEED